MDFLLSMPEAIVPATAEKIGASSAASNLRKVAVISPRCINEKFMPAGLNMDEGVKLMG